MNTKSTLVSQLEKLGVNSNGTILVHSSFKSLGPVEGGPDTVLDAFTEYMRDGLLVFPTHTWDYIKSENPRFSVEESPSCVGILTELFRKRPGVVRSWHPTHSVAALGNDAVSFTSGDEQCQTPCARDSAWGRLLDREAQILLIGVDLRRNTYMHGVEEWLDIPGRIASTPEMLYTVTPDGQEIPVPSYRHTGLPWSEHFWKVEDVFIDLGAVKIGRLGDAEVRLCDSVKIMEVLTVMLQLDPDLFSDNEPLSEVFKKSFFEKWKMTQV